MGPTDEQGPFTCGFLWSAVLVAGMLLGGLLAPTAAAQTTDVPIYDPVMAEEDGTYYRFGTGQGFEHIDPMAFDDPESGKTFLYWGSHGTPLRVQELADDRMHFKEGTEPTPIVQPDSDEPYGGLIEGTWVIYRDGFYYLFYSGDNCCGKNAHYAAMVARAESRSGPFETMAEAQGTTASTILTESNALRAPGHNSIVQDTSGTDWMLYYAINRDQPTQPNGWDRRVLLMNRLTYDDG